jgi:hypothetical protein
MGGKPVVVNHFNLLRCFMYGDFLPMGAGQGVGSEAPPRLRAS